MSPLDYWGAITPTEAEHNARAMFRCYLAGLRAAAAGQPIDSNPWSAETFAPNREAWARGWSSHRRIDAPPPTEETTT